MADVLAVKSSVSSRPIISKLCRQMDHYMQLLDEDRELALANPTIVRIRAVEEGRANLLCPVCEWKTGAQGLARAQNVLWSHCASQGANEEAA